MGKDIVSTLEAEIARLSEVCALLADVEACEAGSNATERLDEFIDQL